MAPSSISRAYGYGSTENLDKSKLLSRPDEQSERATSDEKSMLVTERRSWAKAAAGCAIAIGALVAVVRSGSAARGARSGSSDGNGGIGFAELNGPGNASPDVAMPRPGVLPPLAFTALNFYHIRDGKPGMDYPWLKDVKLIEPYRETTLAVANARPGYGYRWEIAGGDDDELHATADGAEAVVLLTKLDENVVTIEEVDSDGTVARRIDEVVMVKYVRREIRTLTHDEREELFDAMIKLWAVRVDGGNGREIYGEGYSDIWAINRLHYKAASPEICDHFHDGLGFLVSHALLSNTFEYSLQKVNPKLTLPYWDFTIEPSSRGKADETALDLFGSDVRTPVLQASWFGTRDPEDNMVKDGRWAYTPIPLMRDNNPSGIEPDVYSKLRAPWNINNRAYLTRGLGKMCHVHVEDSYPWPTCEMHYDLLTSFDDFFSWVWYSLYDPHGPVHIWIGGVLDCESAYQEVADLVGEITARELALLSFVHRKNLFRDGFFSCEGPAEMTAQPHELLDSGVCGCHGFDLTQGDDYKTIYATMSFMDDYLGDADEDTQRRLVELLCSSTVNDGDHLQASSSLDPSFWSTHPTMERLWMFSVLTKQVTDFEWPDKDVTYTASDGTSYTESVSMYSDHCEGHRGSDVFPFSLLKGDVNDFTVQTAIKGNPEGGGNVLTNREVLAGLDPNINALSYVYDTFKWTHCEEDGIDFDDAWANQDGDEAEAGVEDGKRAAAANPRVTPRDRVSAGGRTIFKKGVPRYPMYGSLQTKMNRFAKNDKEKEN